jgi:hypothetical protein
MTKQPSCSLVLCMMLPNLNKRALAVFQSFSLSLSHSKFTPLHADARPHFGQFLQECLVLGTGLLGKVCGMYCPRRLFWPVVLFSVLILYFPYSLCRLSIMAAALPVSGTGAGAVSGLVDSIVQHKTFKRLAGYAIQCLEKVRQIHQFLC